MQIIVFINKLSVINNRWTCIKIFGVLIFLKTVLLHLTNKIKFQVYNRPLLMLTGSLSENFSRDFFVNCGNQPIYPYEI